MKVKSLALSLVFLIASGCASTSPAPGQSRWLQPTQAIQLAAEAAPGGVRGVFALQVQATGTQDGYTYLNSELDYRDQRNLTIEIAPGAAGQLETRLGAHPLVALKGKRILVNGVAARTKILFFADGKPTDKYYYQTHIQVTDPTQIVVQPEA